MPAVTGLSRNTIAPTESYLLRACWLIAPELTIISSGGRPFFQCGCRGYETQPSIRRQLPMAMERKAAQIG